jgi:hypothetical protein
MNSTAEDQPSPPTLFEVGATAWQARTRTRTIQTHIPTHSQFPDEVPELVERASLREALLIRVYQC